MDAILQSVFGMRAGARRERLRALLFELGRVSTHPAQLARMSVLRRDLGAPPHPWTGLGRLLRRIDVEIHAQLELRRREAPEGADVLGTLLAAVDEDGAPMSDRELRDELMTMLLAGHETTSTTLAWAFERLVRHPVAWARLRDEAASRRCHMGGRGRARDAAGPARAVARGPQIDAAARIGGVDLPAGTLAYACSYLTHTREDLWPEPERFDPGRFSPAARSRSPRSRSEAGAGAASARRSPRCSCRRCSPSRRAVSTCAPSTPQTSRCGGAGSSSLPVVALVSSSPADERALPVDRDAQLRRERGAVPQRALGRDRAAVEFDDDDRGNGRATSGGCDPGTAKAARSRAGTRR